MSEPTEDVRELLRAIQVEIGAGKCLPRLNRTEQDRAQEEAWNNACDRAISIVRSYRDGVGLFQLTGKVMKVEKTRRAYMNLEHEAGLRGDVK